jgi:PIN domain nuclease of toxin-antitoxin system
MRLLLDTHVFLWFITGDSRLPPTLVGLIRDPGNDVFLSVVSVWEVIVKHQIGKLPLPHPPAVYLPQPRDLHGIASLPLDEESVAELPALPPIHRDPFDRMLICQAVHGRMALLTMDDAIRAYSAHVLLLP